MEPEDSLLPRQPGTARALITDEQGRWLLVGDDRPHWYLPGGLIKQDEAPTVACEREVLEETGLTITVGALLVVAWHAATGPGRYARWSLIFDGGPADSAQPLRLHDNEVHSARWEGPDEALGMLTPAIAHRLTVWRTTPAPVSTYVEQKC